MVLGSVPWSSAVNLSSSTVVTIKTARNDIFRKYFRFCSTVKCILKSLYNLPKWFSPKYSLFAMSLKIFNYLKAKMINSLLIKQLDISKYQFYYLPRLFPSRLKCLFILFYFIFSNENRFFFSSPNHV